MTAIENVPRVLIFDKFNKFLITSLSDKWSFSIDDQINTRKTDYNT